jgi:hypothetical protein
VNYTPLVKRGIGHFFEIILGFFKGFFLAFKDEELRAILIMAIFTLFSGTAFYHYVEGLRIIDAFYFTAITVATVGYGDYTPQTDLGKIFTVVYIFVGIGLIAGFIQKFSKNVITYQSDSSKQKKEIIALRKHLGQKQDTLQNELDYLNYLK